VATALTDLALPELRDFRSSVEAPADLDDFWRGTIHEARAAGGGIRIAPVETPIEAVTIDDLTFPGFAGDPISAWIVRPRGDGPHPVVVEYIGYGGGRGLPGEKLAWASAGYIHVIMDTRGQGSVWGGGGTTPDPHGSGAAAPGYMTRGILDPHDYYFRRVYTDGVLLLDVVAALPGVDASRIAVTGTSQGGGIALAVAALSDRVAAVMPDVPFLCDLPRSITRTPLPPYTEITRYLSVHRDRTADVLRTLSYVDGAVLAPRVSAPALFSVALMDDVVLPSTVFGAFNALGSREKRIEVYEYNGHEGGAFHHWLLQARWLGDAFRR
jgi:cephalosporin-C deacetylase